MLLMTHSEEANFQSSLYKLASIIISEYEIEGRSFFRRRICQWGKIGAKSDQMAHEANINTPNHLRFGHVGDAASDDYPLKGLKAGTVLLKRQKSLKIPAGERQCMSISFLQIPMTGNR